MKRFTVEVVSYEDASLSHAGGTLGLILDSTNSGSCCDVMWFEPSEVTR